MSRSKEKRASGEQITGAEPLWVVTGDLGIFFSAGVSPQTLLNRRLPRTCRRVVGPWPCCESEQSPSRTLDKTSHAAVSGSRVFNTIFWPLWRRKKYRAIFRDDLKRLPSRNALPDQPSWLLLLAHHHIDYAVRDNHNFPDGFSGGTLFDFRSC